MIFNTFWSNRTTYCNWWTNTTNFTLNSTKKYQISVLSWDCSLQVASQSKLNRWKSGVTPLHHPFDKHIAHLLTDKLVKRVFHRALNTNKRIQTVNQPQKNFIIKYRSQYVEPSSFSLKCIEFNIDTSIQKNRNREPQY